MLDCCFLLHYLTVKAIDHSIIPSLEYPKTSSLIYSILQ